MKNLSRWCAAAALAGIVLACYASFCPACAERANVDVWNLPGLLAHLTRLETRDAELQNRIEYRKELIRRKAEAMEDLVREQADFAATVERFRELDRRFGTPADAAGKTPAPTDAERQVTSWLETVLSSRQHRLPPAVVARLRKHLKGKKQVAQPPLAE